MSKNIAVKRFGDCRQSLLFSNTSLWDCRNQVSFLESIQVVENCLVDRGQGTVSANSDRAVQIRSHVKMAIDFWDQAEMSGRSSASLVSAYYCGLNMMKACVLFSDGFASISVPENMRHGLKRNSPPAGARAKFSDESVLVHEEGAFAQIYKAMTGAPIARRSFVLKPILADIAVINTECQDCGIAALDIVGFQFELVENGSKRQLMAKWGLRSSAVSPHPEDFAFFKDGWVVQPSGSFVYEISDAGMGEKEFVDLAVRRELCLIEMFPQEENFTMVTKAKSGFPQECSMLLALFSLSSIARYDPMALERLNLSAEWPLVLSLRRASLVYLARVLIGFAFGRDIAYTYP